MDIFCWIAVRLTCERFHVRIKAMTSNLKYTKHHSFFTKGNKIDMSPFCTIYVSTSGQQSMITYLGKFIPNLSVYTEPLRKLLEKDVIWSFDQPQYEAIKNLKALITTIPVLRYYDPKLPTQVSCDASITGLGAVLEQNMKIIGSQLHMPVAL